MDLPIICTLSEDELRKRKETVLSFIRRTAPTKMEIPGGFRYEFANHAATLREVRRMVELERQCCRFLTFDVIESEKTFRLDVTGSPEALAVIGDLFG